MNHFKNYLSVAGLLSALLLVGCSKEAPTPDTPEPSNQEAGVSIVLDTESLRAQGITVTPKDGGGDIEIEGVRFYHLRELIRSDEADPPIRLTFYAKRDVLLESWRWRERNPLDHSQSLITSPTETLKKVQASPGLVALTTVSIPVQRSWTDGKLHEVRVALQGKKSPIPLAEFPTHPLHEAEFFYPTPTVDNIFDSNYESEWGKYYFLTFPIREFLESCRSLKQLYNQDYARYLQEVFGGSSGSDAVTLFKNHWVGAVRQNIRPYATEALYQSPTPDTTPHSPGPGLFISGGNLLDYLRAMKSATPRVVVVYDEPAAFKEIEGLLEKAKYINPNPFGPN